MVVFVGRGEYGAGRVRPKPKARPRHIDPADLPAEPDLSRPVRDYAVTELFERGDRIQHSTLGLGVVQGIAGNGKISVLFEDGERKIGPSLFDVGKRLSKGDLYESILAPDVAIAAGDPPFAGGVMKSTLDGNGFYTSMTPADYTGNAAEQARNI